MTTAMMTNDATLAYAGSPMRDGTTPQDVAAWMFRQGKSPAEVWEALVQKGADPSHAEEVVKELLEQRRRANEAEQQAEIEASFRAQQEQSGSFLLGAVFALFLGWIALIVSFVPGLMGGQTKKGARVIFAVKLFLSLVFIIAAGPR